MHKDPTLTVAGEFTLRVDTFRVSMNVCGDIDAAFGWLPKGWQFLPGLRRLVAVDAAHALVGLGASVGRGKAGICFEFGAEALRAAPDVVLSYPGRHDGGVVFGAALGRLMFGVVTVLPELVTMPRVDWSMQRRVVAEGQRVAMRCDMAARLLAMGFMKKTTIISHGEHGGCTEYYELRKSSRRRYGEKSIVAVDWWLVRVYDAHDGRGGVYIRTEVEEHLASRKAVPQLLCPSAVTLAALGRSALDAAPLERCERREPVGRVKAALSILASNLPREKVAALEALMRELPDHSVGAAERLVDRFGSRVVEEAEEGPGDGERQ